jgi:hypothetical protein
LRGDGIKIYRQAISIDGLSDGVYEYTRRDCHAAVDNGSRLEGLEFFFSRACFSSLVSEEWGPATPRDEFPLRESVDMEAKEWWALGRVNGHYSRALADGGQDLCSGTARYCRMCGAVLGDHIGENVRLCSKAAQEIILSDAAAGTEAVGLCPLFMQRPPHQSPLSSHNAPGVVCVEDRVLELA